jgi:penicillin-binding protein 1A
MSKDNIKKNLENDEDVNLNKKTSLSENEQDLSLTHLEDAPTDDKTELDSIDESSAAPNEIESDSEVELIRKEESIQESEIDKIIKEVESPKIEAIPPLSEKPTTLSINEKFAKKELPKQQLEDKEIDIFEPEKALAGSSFTDAQKEAYIKGEATLVPPVKPTTPIAPVKDKWEPLKESHQAYVKGFWYLLVASVIGIVLLFVVLSFSDLPDTQALENPRSELASQVFAADGDVLGRYFVENRVPVDYAELSPHIRNALVATEDERYYNHTGIDFRGLARAFVKTGIMGQKSAGGASTITQQLARLLFTGQKASGFKRIVQKLKEWIIAVQLERKYTKQEIMAMYLNKFDFLYDSHGIKAAAETYFGKSQDSLRVEEAAMLVGMLKNPSLFNPRRFPDTVSHRRMVVLKQMLKNDLLSQVEYDSLRKEPLDISNFSRSTHTKGLAQYFRMELGKYVKDILSSDLSKKKISGEPYDIYRDGLKIYTTIDPIYQKHAEDAMLEHMSSLQKKFNKYWTSRSKNPWTYRDEDVTEGEMRARERKIKHLIQNSDRYLAMRNSYLGANDLDPLLAKIEGLKLRDIDIERMLEAEKKKSTLRTLENRNLITKGMANQYRAAIKTNEWETIKTKWKLLQSAVTESFDIPVKMRVFAYTDKMEVDTVMSPLDSIKYHHNFLQIGSIAVDPHTGYVKAWIGGINQKYFAYDHTQSNRQVGSTFKPFVYASAIQQLGVSPCEQVIDLPRTVFPNENNFSLLEPWTPQNSKGEYTGERMTLKEALKKSVNTVSVELMKRLGGTREVRNLVKKMGINADKPYPNGQLRVPDAPSICLGSCDLTVMEMTGSYTTFANNGTFVRPVFVRRIEDKNGRTIFSADLEESDALEPASNYVMVEMLKHTSGGLGLKSVVGGKTGTTNDYVDGWFVGITPTLVTGTWVGGEDRWIRFLDLGNGQGSRMAKPFFQKFMKRLEEDSLSGYDINVRFPNPDVPINIELDCDLYDQPSNLMDDEFDDENGGGGFFEDQFGDEFQSKPDSTINFNRKK